MACGFNFTEMNRHTGSNDDRSIHTTNMLVFDGTYRRNGETGLFVRRHSLFVYRLFVQLVQCSGRTVRTHALLASSPGSLPGLGEYYSTSRCKNLALYIRDCESLCLSDETVKAVGPFYH